MAIGPVIEGFGSENMGINPASRTIAKRAKSEDPHVHWKEPPVDTIHQYTPQPSLPHVHWRDPVVEKVHQYPSRPIYPGKVPPPKPPAESPKGILKNHDDDVLLPPPPPPAPYSGFGEPSELDKDNLSKYPPLIPVPGPSDTSVDDTKINKNYKREEVLLGDVYDQLPEMSQVHSISDPPFVALSPPETFHLQPRADVHLTAPGIAGATSGFVAPDQVYQQIPASTAAASQLLLLPILAIYFKSLRDSFRGRSEGTGGSKRKRSIYPDDQPRRKHARSWNISHDDLIQEDLD